MSNDILKDLVKKEELKNLVKLATAYLKDDKTPYAINKKILQGVFSENKVNTLAKVLLLDTMYSTQLSNVSYAAAEIADAIDTHKYTQDKFANDLKDNKEDVTVINKQYGVQYNDNDHRGKIMLSFWSKYLYFTGEYNFPIFDSLAQETIKKLKANGYFTERKMTNKSIENFNKFYEIVSEIKNDLGLLSYSDLDNLLWLFGKVNRGSFSLLISQAQYSNLLEHVKNKYSNIPRNNDKETKNKWLKRVIRDEVVPELTEENMYNIFGNDTKNPDIKNFVDFIDKCKGLKLL